MRKSKLITSLLLGAICCATAACVSANASGEGKLPSAAPVTQVTPAGVTVSKVGDVYALNEKLYADFLTVDVEGETYEITACNLQYPSGVLYEKKEYELTELGEYTLYYTAKKGDTEVNAQKSFKVLNDNYYVTSASSLAEYRENIPVKYSTATSVKEDYIKEGEVDGIYVSLADGDEFKLAKPIKVAEGMNDLFTLYFNDNYYNHNASNVVITLTDCYDPNNYINFIVDFSQGGSKDVLMFRTAVKGDIESCVIRTDGTGLNYLTNKIIFYRDGERYLYIYGQNRGTQVSANRLSGYTFSLDTTNAFVYVTADMNRFTVNMLNDIDLHKDTSKHFYGFTNGEAYLSIKGVDYSAAATDFIITGLSGHSSQEMKGEKYEDKVEPLIQTSNKTENITVAAGTEIDIFDAEVYDVNFTDVKVMAYYNYGSPNQVSVKIRDNRIALERIGSYALVYTAKDTYGNRAEKIVYLNSIATPTGQGIDYDDNRLEEIKLGAQTAFPEISATGLNGEVEVVKSVTEKATGEKLTLLEDGSFMALRAGEYEIEYLMQDGIYERRFAYTVNGVASDSVAFIDELDLPKYFMKGRTYYLEKFVAYTFETGDLTAREVTVQESVDGGDYQTVENYENYVVNANTSVRFKFSYGGKSVESKAIQVVDCGDRINVNAAGYFVCDDNVEASFVEAENYVRLTATADAAVEFVNPISLSAFDLQFMIPDGSTGFKSIRYVLQDYYDATKQITMIYEQGVGSNSFIVNGETYALERLIGIRREVQYYSSAIRDVDLENRVFLPELFTTDKATLHVYFEGVTAPVNLNLYKVNNQVLNAYGDTARPTIAFKDVRGSYAVGEQITVSPAVVTDVFSTVNNAKTRVSVWDGEENPIKDINGVELTNVPADREYIITLTDITTYYIEYSAQDAFGNKTSKKTELYACDFVSPTITLAGGFNSYTICYAKRGDVVEIAGYTVTDDVSDGANMKVVVKAFSPRSEIIAVTDGKLLVDKAGEYRITYNCMDEAGNTTHVYYTIKVK